ncbi:MAG: alpha/beta fold hydrolase [Sphingobacteriales bacterium]|nr:MAG: alpha/beta fold hydrolase [Sphingobacteriales bacterium]
MRRRNRVILATSITLFVFVNFLAAMHAWKFTHFTEGGTIPPDPRKQGWAGKMQAILIGVSHPKPVPVNRPAVPFTTVRLQSNKSIESWIIPADSPTGTIILFHGYKGEKSSMLDKATVFRSLGYQTMVVDFMGSGGSEGNQTTIGFYEAENVKTCFDYAAREMHHPVILFGTSMGAVAIMKSIHEHQLRPAAVILECPFGTMKQTVDRRFAMMGLPAFPLSSLLMFWGCALNGFNAFAHNPVDYARSMNLPVLLMYGEKDDRVSRAETDAIFAVLPGERVLRTFPEAGHDNYLKKYRHKWTMNVDHFLKGLKSGGQPQP